VAGVATLKTTALMPIGMDKKQLGHSAISGVHQLEEVGEHKTRKQLHREVHDTIHALGETAVPPPSNGDNTAKVGQVSDDEVPWGDLREEGHPDPDGGVLGRPAIDQLASTGSPRDSSPKALKRSSINRLGSDPHPEKLGGRDDERPDHVMDGEAEVVEDEGVPLVLGGRREDGLQINKECPPLEMR
jgi:hypothetical protein